MRAVCLPISNDVFPTRPVSPAAEKSLDQSISGGARGRPGWILRQQGGRGRRGGNGKRDDNAQELIRRGKGSRERGVVIEETAIATGICLAHIGSMRRSAVASGRANHMVATDTVRRNQLAGQWHERNQQHGHQAKPCD